MKTWWSVEVKHTKPKITDENQYVLYIGIKVPQFLLVWMSICTRQVTRVLTRQSNHCLPLYSETDGQPRPRNRPPSIGGKTLMC